MDAKEIIARRVALEVKDGMLVNLGIGLPSLVSNYLPASVDVFFQAENGVIGLGARPPEGMEDPDLTDAGGGLCHGATRRSFHRFRDVLRADPWRASRHDGAGRAAGG